MASDETSTMRTFSLYEFAAILVPGSILATSLWLVPGVRGLLPDGQAGVQLIGTALFLLLSYGAGHVAQAGGNLVELGYWRLWGGPPTDWIRSARRPLLWSEQLNSVKKALRHFVPSLPLDFAEISQEDWRALKAELRTILSEAGKLTRADIMNANYHLCRALPLCCLTLTLVLAFTPGVTCPKRLLLAVLCITIVAASIWRMHRFAEHYAREFFVQLMRMHGASNHPDATSSPR